METQQENTDTVDKAKQEGIRSGWNSCLSVLKVWLEYRNETVITVTEMLATLIEFEK